MQTMTLTEARARIRESLSSWRNGDWRAYRVAAAPDCAPVLEAVSA